MTKEKFICLLRESVMPAATTGVITTVENPPGRNPSASLLALSKWFRALSYTDKTNIARLVENAANECLFGVCAVLDGVRVVDKDTNCFEICRIKHEGAKEPLDGDMDYHDLCQ